MQAFTILRTKQWVIRQLSGKVVVVDFFCIEYLGLYMRSRLLAKRPST